MTAGYGTWSHTLIGALLKVSADPYNWGAASDVIFEGNLNVPPFPMGGANQNGWWPLVDLQDHNLSIVRRATIMHTPSRASPQVGTQSSALRTSDSLPTITNDWGLCLYVCACVVDGWWDETGCTAHYRGATPHILLPRDSPTKLLPGWLRHRSGLASAVWPAATEHAVWIRRL